MSKLVQAKKELAKRRGELSRSAGGGQLTRFNSELANIMIELAEKRAELGVIDKQLKQVEGQLTMATTLDPQVSQIRLAQQALEIANQRVHELETLLAALQEPTATVLGAD
jgi:chromosome segregation ATPase